MLIKISILCKKQQHGNQTFQEMNKVIECVKLRTWSAQDRTTHYANTLHYIIWM